MQTIWTRCVSACGVAAALLYPIEAGATDPGTTPSNPYVTPVEPAPGTEAPEGPSSALDRVLRDDSGDPIGAVPDSDDLQRDARLEREAEARRARLEAQRERERREAAYRAHAERERAQREQLEQAQREQAQREQAQRQRAQAQPAPRAVAPPPPRETAPPPDEPRVAAPPARVAPVAIDRSTARALDAAFEERAPAPTPSTEPVEPDPRSEAVRAAIAGVSPALRACAPRRRGGIARVQLSFRPDGSVRSARASAPRHHLTPIERSCIARTARQEAHAHGLDAPLDVVFDLRL